MLVFRDADTVVPEELLACITAVMRGERTLAGAPMSRRISAVVDALVRERLAFLEEDCRADTPSGHLAHVEAEVRVGRLVRRAGGGGRYAVAMCGARAGDAGSGSPRRQYRSRHGVGGGGCGG